MGKLNRSQPDIEVDFIAEYEMLSAISRLLITASRNNGTVPEDIVLTISMYLEGHLENLEAYFIEMTTLAGGSEHYVTEK